MKITHLFFSTTIVIITIAVEKRIRQTKKEVEFAELLIKLNESVR